MKTNKILKTLSFISAPTLVVSSALAVASCGCVPALQESIPADCYLVKDGTITGLDTSKDLTKYTVAKLPTDSSINAIGEGAFKNIFSNKTNDKLPKITKLTIGNNIKKIGKEAFFGCDSIETIDLSSYESDESLNTLLSDDNCDVNCFASMAQAKKGKVVFNSKISDACKNQTKTSLIVAGLTKEWFLESEKPDIGNMKVVGTSNEIYGEQYVAKTDTNKWNCSYEGFPVSTNCQWTAISQTSESLDWLTVNKDSTTGQANLQWPIEAPAGQHKFNLIAKYVRPGQTETTSLASKSETITLTINEKKLSVVGKTTLSGSEGVEGSQQYEIKYDGKVLASGVELSLSNTYDNKIKITNAGLLSWSGLANGVYTFDINAKYTEPVLHDAKTAKLSITLNIGQKTFEIDGVSSISGTVSTTLKSAKQFNTMYDGKIVNAQWTFTNVPEGWESKISRDSDGYIEIYQPSEVGSYSFTVNASYTFGGITKTASKDVDVEVKETEFVISGSKEIETKETIGSSTKYVATYQGSEVSATWSSANLPTGVTLDSASGLLSWSGETPIGEYSFTIKAQYTPEETNETLTATIDVTMTVSERHEEVKYKTGNYIYWDNQPKTFHYGINEFTAKFHYHENFVLDRNESSIVVNETEYKWNTNTEKVSFDDGNIKIKIDKITSISINIYAIEKSNADDADTQKYLAEEQLSRKLEFTTDAFYYQNCQGTQYGVGMNITPKFVKAEGKDVIKDGDFEYDIIWADPYRFQIHFSIPTKYAYSRQYFEVNIDDTNIQYQYKLNKNGQNYEADIDADVIELTNDNFNIVDNVITSLKSGIVQENKYYYIKLNLSDDTGAYKIANNLFVNPDESTPSWWENVCGLEIYIDSKLNYEYYFGSRDSESFISLKSLKTLRYLTIQRVGDNGDDNPRIILFNGALPRPLYNTEKSLNYNESLQKVWLRGVECVIADTPEQEQHVQMPFAYFTELKEIYLGKDTTFQAGYQAFAGNLSLQVVDYTEWDSVAALDSYTFAGINSWATDKTVYVKDKVDEWTTSLSNAGLSIGEGDWAVKTRE